MRPSPTALCQSLESERHRGQGSQRLWGSSRAKEIFLVFPEPPTDALGERVRGQEESQVSDWGLENGSAIWGVVQKLAQENGSEGEENRSGMQVSQRSSERLEMESQSLVGDWGLRTGRGLGPAPSHTWAGSGRVQGPGLTATTHTVCIATGSPAWSSWEEIGQLGWTPAPAPLMPPYHCAHPASLCLRPPRGLPPRHFHPAVVGGGRRSSFLCPGES